MILTKPLQEQTSEKAVKYLRSFSNSRKKLFQLSNQSVRNVLSLIRDFRADAIERLRFNLPQNKNDGFDLKDIPDIESSIRQSINTLTTKTKKELSDRLNDSFDLGQGVTARALTATGVPVFLPQITRVVESQSFNLQEQTEDIFDGLFGELGLKISLIINNSAEGLISSSQAMQQINQLLKTAPEEIRGQRRRLGTVFQAEEIIRTELGRIYSTAQQAASEQLLNTIPNLKKRWLSAGDLKVRRGHKLVEETYSPGGIIGPIPIKQRFKVTDFSRTGRTNFVTVGGGSTKRIIRTNKPFTRRGRIIVDRMLFPRDPDASAGNVVFCRCTVIDVVPELEDAMNRTIGIIQ